MKSKINRLIYIIKLIPRLGYWNVGYTIWYKLSLKFGWRKRLFPTKNPIEGTFFKPTYVDVGYKKIWKDKLELQVKDIYNGIFTWFSYHKFNIGIKPNWFKNPFTNTQLENPESHWTELNDFDLLTGDIKIIWELSRFDWLTTLARGYKVFGEEKYLERLNNLLMDWTNKNPTNMGPNWKCGQEASIRVMKLLTTAELLDQFSTPDPVLQEMIFQHLERIVPNINYAIAQDNNHGTSEASALYIAATWLIQTGYEDKKLLSWKRRGRRILEERILKLVMPEGSFSQQSLTYHRVMIDTISFVLQMMKQLKEEPLSNAIVERLNKLGEWQYKMTFGTDGDGPNYGSNDGAMFDNLHSCDFRDFRASTQTFFGLLNGTKIYLDEEISENLYWRLKQKINSLPQQKINLPVFEILDNQYVFIRKNNIIIMVKKPDDTFRPGNDVFHMDLWYKGQSILVDNGTYSYNSDKYSDYFKSVSAHNTVQFGQHEQMPKISRFLNGEWIKKSKENVSLIGIDSIEWSGSYSDYKGNYHQRKIVVRENKCTITDSLKSTEKAISRFYINEKNQALYNIMDEVNYKKSTQFSSKYYMEKGDITLLEKEINKESIFEISFI